MGRSVVTPGTRRRSQRLRNKRQKELYECEPDPLEDGLEDNQLTIDLVPSKRSTTAEGSASPIGETLHEKKMYDHSDVASEGNADEEDQGDMASEHSADDDGLSDKENSHSDVMSDGEESECGNIHGDTLSESYGENPVDSDSDEGPEDVSLATGRTESMSVRRSEQDHVKRVEEAVKEKRRKQHELYRTQKMTKTLSKFPEQALAEVSIKLAEKKASKRARKRLKKKLNHRKLLEATRPSKAQHGSVTVMALEEQSGQEFVGGASSKDFRLQHFYGERLTRLPVLSIQAKKYRNRPAKNFVKSV